MNQGTVVPRNILVIGGNGSLGRSLVAKLSPHPRSRVYVAVSSASSREKFIADLNFAAGDVFVSDLSVPGSATILLQEVAEQVGKLDAVINLVGRRRIGSLSNLRHPELLEDLQLNFLSCVELGTATLQTRAINDGGQLLFTSTIAAHKPERGIPSYIISKGGLETLTKLLAVELGHLGIRVNLLTFGLVASQMSEDLRNVVGKERFAELEHRYPFGLGDPGNIAEIIEFMLSEKSRWATGSNFIFDGGRLTDHNS